MTPAEQLTQLMQSDHHDIPLDLSLLLLAASRPDGEDSVDRGLDALDEMAAGCPEATPAGLSHHLFHQLGFTGDDSDYHNPHNSFFDIVLARRVGMPITLAAVMIETARRLGFSLVGIGMPGHFLVREAAVTGNYLDPFAAGDAISETECRSKFASLHGPSAQFDERFLEPVDNRAILGRVLNNLTVSFRTRNPSQLDWLLDLRLGLPGPPPQQVALAGLCEGRGRFSEAALLLDQVADATGDERARVRASALRARLN